MSSIINTNINSITAQRNLGMNQLSLSTSMQRLSSGLRINSAKDDAAGLAISDRFTSQIRGFDQAARNANDGISLAQTAEGALAQITDNLQRIRELAVQSANATNSSSDRAALDQEVQQRLAEIDRVAAQTQFNGLNILDGSFGSAAFQVGANVGQTISVSLTQSMRTATIGRRADYSNSTTAFDTTKAIGAQGTGVNTTALASGEVTITVGTGSAVTIGAAVAGTATGQGTGSAYAKLAAIKAAGVSGLNAEADTTVTLNVAASNAAAYTLTINGTSIFNAAAIGTVNGTTLATAINNNSGATGVTATFANGVMTLNAADGRDIVVDQSAATAGDGLLALSGSNNATNVAVGSASGANVTYSGSIRLSSNEQIVVGGTTPAQIGYTAATLALGASALNSSNVKTVNAANNTVYAVDASISTVSSLRSTFGAIQNRFDSVIANLSTTVENLTASRSRVQDADFAKETANLSRSQILQQAGTAMVAQANQLPQGVLALLR